jgi:dephospho-CoA kinase
VAGWWLAVDVDLLREKNTIDRWLMLVLIWCERKIQLAGG